MGPAVGLESMMLTFPNLLTLSRIIVIPLLVAAFFLETPLARWVTCALFTAAALTDFLDGYLARSWDQVTRLGRILDPVADKIMVSTVLFMMVALGWITGWLVLAALVILIREIMVSGMREFLAEIRIGMPVSRLAKWKTLLQMAAIALLLLGDAGPPALHIPLIGTWGLWIAAGLTIVTGYDYLQTGVIHMNEAGDGRGEERRPVEAAGTDKLQQGSGK